MKINKKVILISIIIILLFLIYLIYIFQNKKNNPVESLSGLSIEDSIRISDSNYFYTNYDKNLLIPIQQSNGSYGYVNIYGIKITEPLFYNAKFLNSKNNTVMLEYKNEGSQSFENTKFGIMKFIQISSFNSNNFLFNYFKARQFSDGLAAVFNGEKWGYVNEDGNQVIEYLYYFYDEGGDFYNGLARVMNAEENWGFINKNGEPIIPFKYNSVGNFTDNFTWILEDDGCSYIDKEGEKITDEKFFKCNDAFEGNAVFEFMDKSIGIIDENGEITKMEGFTKILNFSEQKAIGIKDSKYGIIFQKEIEKDNKKVKEFEFIPLGEYTSIGSFHNNRAKIEINGMYGYIDENLNVRIKAQYEDATDFNNFHAIVWYQNAKYIINYLGKVNGSEL